MSRILSILLIAGLLSACTSTRARDYSNAISDVDRAIAIANEHRGSMKLTLHEGDPALPNEIMVAQPGRQAEELCGDYYINASEREYRCLPLSAIAEIEVYDEQIDLGRTATVAALSVVFVPFILLMCVLDCDAEIGPR